MENINHFGYFAKNVASDLEITTSSLRRWSIVDLEKAGYTIERNEKNSVSITNGTLKRLVNYRSYFPIPFPM